MRRTQVWLSLCAILVSAAFVGCGGSGQSASDHQTTNPPAPADFTVAVSVQSVFVPIGAGSGTLQISVQAVNGFSHAVSVSLMGLPSGVTSSPSSPLTISPGSNQTVTLTVARGTQPSVQNITLQATSGTLNHMASFSLSVADPSYAYLATGYPSQPPYGLNGFSVDANTGALATVPGSPVTLSAPPVDLAVASETGGAFVFLLIPDSGAGTVTLQSYSVNVATGALTPLQTINYPPNTNQATLAVHPSQKFLYVVQSGCIIAYLIDPSTGNLTQSSCSTLQTSPGLVVVPPGNFAYQIARNLLFSATWFIFSVNQSDGSLTLLQSYNDSSAQNGELFTDPQGRALYETVGPIGHGTCGSFGIWQIDSSSGALTNLNTSFSPLCQPFSVVFNPADTYGYVSSGGGEFQGPNGIYAGMADPTTGNLTTVAGSPFASGIGASFVAVEPLQGKFVMEATTTLSNGGQLLTFAIDANTGALSQVAGVRGALPTGNFFAYKMLAVAPSN